MVPLDRCVSVQLGPISTETLRRLLEGRFDHAPAIRDGFVEGIVSTDDLRLKMGMDGPPEVVRSDAVPSFAPNVGLLSELLRLLHKNRAAIVGRPDAARGLVTISDLNKHVFRAQLYPLFAHLEAVLADLVDREFTDPWAWIGSLGHGDVQVVGHWELLKRKGLDVTATVGTTLSQLLRVAASLPQVLEAFGSKSRFREFAGRASNYRNAIMHPARPLIVDKEDVGSLARVVIDTQKLLEVLA